MELPGKKGRTWYECDANYGGKRRGAERALVVSSLAFAAMHGSVQGLPVQLLRCAQKPAAHRILLIPDFSGNVCWSRM